MIPPLLGPSTLIHVFIVIIGKTANYAKQILKKKKNGAKIISLIIMLSVLLLIFGFFYYAIRSSVKSDKSNLNIMQNLLAN